MANEDYSLESILADVNDNAFIDRDSKTSSHIIEAEAERILREATMSFDNTDTPLAPPPQVDELISELKVSAPEDSVPYFDEAPVSAQEESYDFSHNTEYDDASAAITADEFDLPQTPIETPEAIAERLLAETESITGEDFNESALFSPFTEPEFDDAEELPVIITPTEDAEPALQDDSSYAGSMSFGSFTTQTPNTHSYDEEQPSAYVPLTDTRDATAGDITAKSSGDELFEQVIIPDDEEIGVQIEDEEEFFEEPRLKDRAIKFARSCNSLSRRLLPASVITLIMVLITIVFEADMLVPYGIGDSLVYATLTLVLLQLIVMMLCVEVLIKGVDFMVSGSPNAETLVLFSCVFSLLSATYSVLSGFAQMLPFCAVSALSLIFAAYGERMNLRAMTDSLKIAISSPEPYGVGAEYNENLDDCVIKKTYNRTDGFYTNMVSQDITEILYKFATPVLLVIVLLITVINVLLNRVVENSLHILSALLAAAAPFSLLLAYPVPYSIVASALRKVGVAIAGWGGADEIAHTDGVCVTDDDMFPTGTLKLSSIKVFDGASQSNVLCYTGSLIIASGSGLAGLFAEALEEKRLPPLRVADFECHESGISAIIQGHQVATGSAAHMNLIGVRVPDDSNMRNAVFTAVNNRLVAVFTIDYKPLPSVQGALISLLKWRISLYFAMRDFNITPSMVGLKFKVPFESFVFMPVKESYSISDPYTEKQGRMAAVLVRESLVPYSEAITSARLLRSAAFFATILSIASAGLGVFLMFLMLWDGSFASATPGNLMLYMLAMLAAVLVVCGYVKIKK